MLTVRLLLRAVRWRAAAAVAVLVVAVVAVVSAAIGPIYLHAVDGVVLRQGLGSSDQAERDVRAAMATAPSTKRTDYFRILEGAVAPVEDTRWFGPAVRIRELDVKVDEAGTLYVGRLADVATQCAQLVFVAGRCPTGPNEAIASDRSRAGGGFVLGTQLTVGLSNATNTKVRLVGLYRPLDAAASYWGGGHFFDAHPSRSFNDPPRLDTLFVSDAAIDQLATAVPVTTVVDVPLLPDRVRQGDISSLRQLITATQATARARFGAFAASDSTVESGLPQVLNRIVAGQRLPGTLVLIASLQLALLALAVLGAVVAATASTREPEIALAKLRGRRFGAVLWQAAGEPVAMVVLACPIGIALARLVVGLTAPRLLGAGALVTTPWQAIALGIAVSAVAVLVCGLAVGRLLFRRVGDLLHRATTEGWSPAVRVAAEVAVVVLAVAAFVELRQRGLTSSAGHPDALAVLVPTTLVVAVAVLAVEVVPRLVRPLVRRTANSRRLATFLVVRQLVRRPAGLRVAALLTVAVGIVTFASASWSMAAHNRHVRAESDNGAARVLTVAPKPGVDLISAVRSADPSGRQAMAVELHETNGTPMLAVDSSRLAEVAFWARNDSSVGVAAIERQLAPRVASPVVLTGTQVRLRIKTTVTPPHPYDLTLVASDPDHRPVTVDLGTLAPGEVEYSGSLSPDCAAGCRLAALTLRLPASGSSNPADAGTIASFICLDIEASADGRSWTPVSQAFSAGESWRGEPTTNADVTPSGTGLAVQLRLDSSTGVWGSAVPGDLPAHLPAVVASATAQEAESGSSAPGGPGTLSIAGLDGLSIPVATAGQAIALPRLDRTGVMVDLTLAERAQSDVTAVGTAQQVWLAPRASAALLDRLRQAGLTVTASDDVAAHQLAYDHSGPTYAIDLFLLGAVVAAVLAVAAAVAHGLVSARRRSYEFAALRVVGVAQRALGRAALGEQSALLAFGMAVGVATGVVGGVVSAPSLPFFVDADSGPPVQSTVSLPTMALVCGLLVVLFGLAAVIVAWAERRHADVATLRAGER